jgi:LAO/AO transport system kinase
VPSTEPRELFDGDRRALARALTTVETNGAGRDDLLRQARARSGRAAIVGLTGPPGAGKSTLIDRLITAYRRTGKRVAVLAIDPTSPFTGGAVLGDRVRMQGHSGDDGVFIRSVATRGAQGGVARAAADLVMILGASGFDFILIETVGVGQGEIDVHRLADITLVLAVPGAGDDIQALKSGLMEIADAFVVNKADREGAEAVAIEIQESLSLRDSDSRSGPPVVLVSAATGQGIDELVGTIDELLSTKRASPAPALVLEERRSVGSDVGVLGIDHIGIASPDETRGRGFFEKLLGLEGEPSEEVGRDRVSVAFLGKGETRVELVVPTTGDSPVAAFIEKRGGGLHHIAFRVADLDRALAVLRDRGVRLIDETARPGAHGRRVAFVHPASAEGVLVELVEAKPDR